MEWPARCPDLNPISNLLVILARNFHANKKQVSTLDDFMECVESVWNSFAAEVI